MIDIDNIYVVQNCGYGLGNFVMCTHTIRALYDIHKKPIKVCFGFEWVAEYFKGAIEIEAIPKSDMPKYNRLFNSSLINRVIYDGQFILNTIRKKHNLFKDMKLPKAICGNHGISESEVDVVIISGNGSVPTIAKNKLIPENVYNHILSKLNRSNLNISVVGSSKDFKDRLSTYNIDNCRVVLDDPSEISRTIRKAKFVISNDTGLYHYSSAMNKKQFVMWNQTNLDKNFNPDSVDYTFVSRGSWLPDFDEWIEKC